MAIEKVSEEIKTIENVSNNDSIKELVKDGSLPELAEVIIKMIEKLDELTDKINSEHP